MVRARDLGICIGWGVPGPHNAITDVDGIRVGYATIVADTAVRTGVTIIIPFEGVEPLFAGTHRLNGNGEMTGYHYIREMGTLISPIAITNTHSVGAVHAGLVAHWVSRRAASSLAMDWALPVVAETWDGFLNDINGFHVTAAHVEQALADAHGGAIAEGNVGGGTGMICHGFKGGTGTASRLTRAEDGGYTVGVLVQANHGRRSRLMIDGVAVGDAIPPEQVPLPHADRSGQGSIIVIVATDAPLIPTQCDRLAQRAALGIARTGGVGEDSSGDLCLAFATGNRGLGSGGSASRTMNVTMLRNAAINPLFDAVVEATEEAIINALVAARTMTGKEGATAHALPHDRLMEVLGRSERRGSVSD